MVCPLHPKGDVGRELNGQASKERHSSPYYRLSMEGFLGDETLTIITENMAIFYASVELVL